MRVDGMLCVQVHQGADCADETFGGLPVGDDLAGQHRVQQLRQLPVKHPAQRLRALNGSPAMPRPRVQALLRCGTAAGAPIISSVAVLTVGRHGSRR